MGISQAGFPGYQEEFYILEFPMAWKTAFFQLGRVLVVSIISGFGTVQIAANAVANNLDGMGCIPGNAMNLAMITVIGQCVGARGLRPGFLLY